MPEQIEAPFSDIFATHMQDAHARIPFPVSIATSGVRRPSPRRSSIAEIQNEKLTSLLRQETIEAAELWSALRSRSGTVSRPTSNFKEKVESIEPVKERRSPGISSANPTKINFELIVALWGLANSNASDMRHQARGLKCSSQQRARWFDKDADESGTSLGAGPGSFCKDGPEKFLKSGLKKPLVPGVWAWKSHFLDKGHHVFTRKDFPENEQEI
ncbi:hypothetical protein B0H14DRAFT_2602289 [Mycena olivaceomarginata]|nr:hypothetical protein B0H14DRAFT_2602289 [Mycena olivaceomarginata]